MGRVIIGMDPHKRSATIEAIDEHEQVLTNSPAVPGGRHVRIPAVDLDQIRDRS